MATYQVTGPVALVKDSAGKVRYYYTGAQLPADVDAEQLERLTARGLVCPVEAPPVAAAGGQMAAQADESAGTAPVDTPPGTSTTTAGALQRPPQVAPKTTWVDYAVACGMDRDKAEAMTKDKLIDAFPPE